MADDLKTMTACLIKHHLNKCGNWRSLIIVRVLVLLAVLGLSGCDSVLPVYQLDSYSGKVVDAQTGRPIANAAVLVEYYQNRRGSEDGDWQKVDVRETRTDENGVFNLPQQREWFGEKRGLTRGRVRIFHPGYGTLFHSEARAVNANKSWPPPDRLTVYELPQLSSKEERLRNLPLLNRLEPEKCPYFIKLVREERIFLESGYRVNTDKSPGIIKVIPRRSGGIITVTPGQKPPEKVNIDKSLGKIKVIPQRSGGIITVTPGQKPPEKR
jgi:hypothetical protein